MKILLQGYLSAIQNDEAKNFLYKKRTGLIYFHEMKMTGVPFFSKEKNEGSKTFFRAQNFPNIILVNICESTGPRHLQ